MTTMNPPVLIWQRGSYRIIAVDHECDDGASGPFLVLERLELDFMNQDAWVGVMSEDEGAQYAINAMKLEIASRVEVVPVWVRDFIQEEMAEFAEECADTAS